MTHCDLHYLWLFQTKEAENKAIVEGIKNNSKDKAEIVIKKVSRD